ncbi:MAG: DUF3990 domain-containing protein [Bryobacteraceae bacterium]
MALVVFHGTVDSFAESIVSGVTVGHATANTDFGPGFYTTTVKRQAQMWAARLSATRPGTSPAAIEIVIRRPSLASLEALAFVRGDFGADDYWSLIHHCRKGALGHGRLPPAPSYYDVVYGPVAAFWNQRMVVADADQISFHTMAAEAVLNASPRTRII